MQRRIRAIVGYELEALSRSFLIAGAEAILILIEGARRSHVGSLE